MFIHKFHLNDKEFDVILDVLNCQESILAAEIPRLLSFSEFRTLDPQIQDKDIYEKFDQKKKIKREINANA